MTYVISFLPLNITYFSDFLGFVPAELGQHYNGSKVLTTLGLGTQSLACERSVSFTVNKTNLGHELSFKGLPHIEGQEFSI